MQPQVTQVPLDAGSQFAEHTTLHFDQYDGDGGGTGGLTVHRFVVQGDDVRGTGREAGTLDATITRAAAAVKAEDPAGALRSNGGGYHSAASLRGRAEDPNDQCWGELHAILDEAATAAVQFEIGAGACTHNARDARTQHERGAAPAHTSPRCHGPCPSLLLQDVRRIPASRVAASDCTRRWKSPTRG